MRAGVIHLNHVGMSQAPEQTRLRLKPLDVTSVHGGEHFDRDIAVQKNMRRGKDHAVTTTNFFNESVTVRNEISGLHATGINAMGAPSPSRAVMVAFLQDASARDDILGLIFSAR